MYDAPALASRPVTTVPWGLAGFVGWVDPGIARLASGLVVVGATLGLLGWWARTGFALVALGGLYVLALPQLHGATLHAHHLVWLAALLAVSPASDALSVGRFRPLRARSAGWGVPVWMAAMILALVYFFPGLHKVWEHGPGWADDPLRHHLWWKWAQSWDFVPLTRIDRWPTVLWLGGLGVIAFEVGAPLLVGSTLGRRVFAGLASGFHAGTALWFDIHFASLWLCFGVLLPAPPRGVGVPNAARPVLPALLVGTALLVGIAVPGLEGRTQAYPFACYPTFTTSPEPWMPTLMAVGVTADGGEHPVPERALADDGQRFYREAWTLLGLYGPRNEAALEPFWRRVEGRPAVRSALGPSTEVVLYRAWRTVDPEHPRTRRGTVLGRFGVSSASRTGAHTWRPQSD